VIRAVQDTLLSYLGSGPDPGRVVPYECVVPSGELTREVVLPLVARRNMRDALRYLCGASVAVDVRADLFDILSDLAHDEMDTFFTQPEVTDWVDRVRVTSPIIRRPNPNDLVLLLIAQYEKFRGNVPDRLVRYAPEGEESHRRIAGYLLRRDSDNPDGVRLPVLEVEGISVQGLPCVWLSVNFPEVDWISVQSKSEIRQRANIVAAALDLTERSWPEAAAELKSIVRWIVPLNVVESFNVPAMRGLLAFDALSVWRTSADLVHEASHNALSNLLDLFTVSRSPLDPVRSPFSNESGPLTSLVHSCWSFTREIELQRRFVRLGMDIPRYTSTWRKTMKFFELAEQVLGAHNSFTPFGAELVRGVLDRAGAIAREGL